MKNPLTFKDLRRKPDIICFSHLRWNFVFQRPQHLMSRFSKYARVFIIEECIKDAVQEPYLELNNPVSDLWVATPHLKEEMTAEDAYACQKELIDQLFRERSIDNFISWYYTPMSLYFSAHLQPLLVIYDCMDELSAFRFAPVELREKETELLQYADIVFTGGHSLYEAKHGLHSNIHCFSSSVDVAHFAKARTSIPEPEDQKHIPYPRFGFFGVLDERLDTQLLRTLADMKPQWHFILIGPTAKIEPASLPQAHNIHYLGMKSYEALPNYISYWSVAVLLFALNESTRFISPTKTPEYLAAGKPVISTPIQDVVHSYGDTGLAHIAGDAESFIAAGEKILGQQPDKNWQVAVEKYLSQTSWERTWESMANLICRELIRKEFEGNLKNFEAYV